MSLAPSDPIRSLQSNEERKKKALLEDLALWSMVVVINQLVRPSGLLDHIVLALDSFFQTHYENSNLLMDLVGWDSIPSNSPLLSPPSVFLAIENS